jgi:hypothetical protein
LETLSHRLVENRRKDSPVYDPDPSLVVASGPKARRGSPVRPERPGKSKSKGVLLTADKTPPVIRKDWGWKTIGGTHWMGLLCARRSGVYGSLGSCAT